jgi:hypothetical protein
MTAARPAAPPRTRPVLPAGTPPTRRESADPGPDKPRRPLRIKSAAGLGPIPAKSLRLSNRPAASPPPETASPVAKAGFSPAFLPGPGPSAERWQVKNPVGFQIDGGGEKIPNRNCEICLSSRWNINLQIYLNIIFSCLSLISN